MSDPRDEFLTDVDFNQIEVREYPKIAFLCGGNPEVLFTPDSSKQYFLSARSYISHLLTITYSNLRCQNAEDVKDWNSYSVYDDLIEFERDIAHICKAIVLFVESPGSIAELGSFAIIPEISEKLIVFVHSDYAEPPSFISLGPLKRIDDDRRRINEAKKRIDEDGKSRIHFIAWSQEETKINGETIEFVRPESFGEWGKYTCNEINSLLESRCYVDHLSDNYRRTKEALFIHDIVSLFKAVTEDEILKYFKSAKHDMQKQSLQRSLFCLKKLALVRTVLKGNSVYYVPDDPSGRRYLTLNGGLDTVRLAIRLDAYYQHPSHLARREAIREAVRGGR